MFKNIENFIRGKVLFDEPMSKHTSYGIGGPAKAYITPSDKEDLKSILKYSTENNVPTFFVGSGSNLLVSDEGIDGLVITLGRSFNNLEIDNNKVFAQTGVMLGKMVKECIKRRNQGELWSKMGSNWLGCMFGSGKATPSLFRPSYERARSRGFFWFLV